MDAGYERAGAQTAPVLLLTPNLLPPAGANPDAVNTFCAWLR